MPSIDDIIEQNSGALGDVEWLKAEFPAEAELPKPFWKRWLDRASAWVDKRRQVPPTHSLRGTIVANIYKWSLHDIEAMSDAIRAHGQPDSPGFQAYAVVALNALRADEDYAYRRDVQIVAKAMARHSNPGLDVDLPPGGSHYMAHLPLWMSFVEYARPAVAAYRKRQVNMKPGGHR